MKKYFISFLLLVAACIFYISIIVIPVGIILFVLDPNLFYGLIVLFAAIILSIYRVIMKRKPAFQKLIFNFWEQIPPFGA